MNVVWYECGVGQCGVGQCSQGQCSKGQCGTMRYCVGVVTTPADPDAQGDTVMEGEMATLSCALQDGVADKTEWIGT